MRKTRQITRPPRPNALPDPFAEPSADAGLATITHGPYVEQVPVAGMTVGAIRTRFRDRYDIPSDGIGLLDGDEVGDHTVVAAGQLLTFMHRANAKGVGAATVPAVALDGHDVVVTEPEGALHRMPFGQAVSVLVPRWFGECVWPDGVKLVRELARGAIVVHQTPARVHSLEWIAEDSPVEFGAGVRYRRVRLALPYVLVLAVYTVDRTGSLQLSMLNECMFANAPLRSMDDPLFLPALLNISKFEGHNGLGTIAWLCTQHLDRQFRGIPDPATRARAGLDALVGHLFQGGFNRSSEHNEGASWFAETVAAGVDERVASVEAWEAATRDDPLFATEVEWLPSGTVGENLARIASSLELEGPVLGALDLARIAVSRRAAS